MWDLQLGLTIGPVTTKPNFRPKYCNSPHCLNDDDILHRLRLSELPSQSQSRFHITMCDSLPSLPLTSSIKFRPLWFTQFESLSPLLSNSFNSGCSTLRNCCLLFPSRTNVTKSLSAFVPKRNRFSGELEFKGADENLFDVDPSRSVANLDDIDGNFTDRIGDDFMDQKDGGEGKKKSSNRGRSSEGERDLVPIEDKEAEIEKESEIESGKVALRKRRQVMRRSNMLAKQVISIQTALSLGFISQLWVDTAAVSDTVPKF